MENLYEELEEQIKTDGSDLNTIIVSQLPYFFNGFDNYSVIVGNYIKIRTDHSILYTVELENEDESHLLKADFVVSSDGYFIHPDIYEIETGGTNNG